MSSIRLIDHAQEITESLTKDCPFHSNETHRDLSLLFRKLSHTASVEVSRQCRMMSGTGRALVEEVAIRVGLDTLPLYASSDSHPRTEAATLAIALMPLSMEITRSFYCPELPITALDNDISLKSHCINSVTNFLNDSIEAHAPVWQDVSLVRGRYLLEVFGGFTGQSDGETRWIGDHSIELASHVLVLEDCKMIDRAFCESLLTTTTPLLNGIL